jgi:DNA-binding NarL/FixJ family response regulator
MPTRIEKHPSNLVSAGREAISARPSGGTPRGRRRPSPGVRRSSPRPRRRSSPGGGPAFRILLSIPNRLLESLLRKQLDAVPGWDVLKSVPDPHRLPGALELLSPDVLIMDLTDLPMPGLLVAAECAGASPGTMLCALLPALRPRHQKLLEGSGISAVLPQDCNERDLVHLLKCIASGRPLPAGFAGPRHNGQRPPAGSTAVHRPAPDPLSGREKEVLRLVARGFSSREIGERLFLSPRTIECHIANLLKALGLDEAKQLSCALYKDEDSPRGPTSRVAARSPAARSGN